MFPAKALQWSGPLLAAGALAALVVVIFLSSGIYSFAATTPDPAGAASIIHSSFLRSTVHHADDLPGPPADFGSPAQIAKGAGYYGMACAHCHGAPGLGQNPIVTSMRPRPQYLVAVVSQFSDRSLFRIVKHGVKPSGMPAFPTQHRDDEVWSIVSFLRQLPTMTVGQYRALAYGDDRGIATSPVPALADDFRSRPYPANGRDELAPPNYRRTSPALGFDSFAMGGDVAGYCTRCHVDNGRSKAGSALPDITLLDPRYFRRALASFANGTRHSGFMFPVATQLSAQQMDALARYYTAQPRRAQTPSTAPPATLALGDRIANEGLNARRADACSNCHSIDRASAAAYPSLDGQHLAYLIGRLRQYRASPVTKGNPMPAIARRLDDRAIGAVSAWYASQPVAPRR